MPRKSRKTRLIASHPAPYSVISPSTSVSLQARSSIETTTTASLPTSSTNRRLPKPAILHGLINRHQWNLINYWYSRHNTTTTTRYCTVHHTVFRLKDAIENNIPTIDPPETLEELDSRCRLMDRKPSAWFDRDSVKLLHYFPNLFGRDNRNLLIQELKDLISKSPPRSPKNEQRHAHFEQHQQKMKKANLQCGVYRLTVHQPQGHRNETPAPSASLLAGSVKYTITLTNFRRSKALENLSFFVSQLFAAIDPEVYARYRIVYLNVIRTYSIISYLDPNPLQCFVGYYILINMLTEIHIDVNDPPDGWVAMAVFGDHVGGELCLPDIEIALPYKDCDIVFIRSRALRHFIRQFEGDRYVIVFNTPEVVMNWSW